MVTVFWLKDWMPIGEFPLLGEATAAEGVPVLWTTPIVQNLDHNYSSNFKNRKALGSQAFSESILRFTETYSNDALIGGNIYSNPIECSYHHFYKLRE